VFTASIADINKALAVKQHTDLRKKMPACFYKWLDVTDHKRAELLLLAQGISINYTIKLKKDNSSREKEVP
jgi:hypothetical protein